MQNRKKGELTARQIILLLLAVLGFIIMLFVFFAIKGNDYTEDEICHLSVLTRATSPESVNTYIPLKCTTKKICLSEKGECREFAGEESIKKVKLPSDGKSAGKKIAEESANAMYDCWKMMGEGKLSLWNGGVLKGLGFKKDEPVCVICSRISVNADDNKIENIMKNVDLENYLLKNKVPGSSLSYMQKFTDRGVSSYAKVDEDSVEKIKKVEIGEDSYEKSREMAVVFTQIKPRNYEDVIDSQLKALGTITGASFIMAPVSTARAAAAAVTSVKGIVLVGVAAAGVELYAMSNVYQGRAAAAGYCGKFSGLPDQSKADSASKADEEGCSTVQILPYDFKVLNNICKQIDGSP